MDTKIKKAVGDVVNALTTWGARKTTAYLSENLIVRATAQFRPDGRNTRNTYLLTIGSPNFVERRFIRLCKKAGEPLPVKKIQFKFWPEKKAK